MGAPVVLLHSGGMSSRQWSSLAAGLESEHAVLAPDFLGHGAEPWPDGTSDALSADVERILALVASLNAPAHLVGHSYGGMVALQVARREPAAVASLALFEPIAFGVLHDPPDPEGLADLERFSGNAVLSAAGEGPGGLEAWLEAFVEFWSGRRAWQAMGDAGQRGFRQAGWIIPRGVAALMADRTPVRAYGDIRVLALVMAGDRSPVCAQRTAAVLAAELPSARLEVLPGAGHMGPLTHMAAVNALVAKHVAAVPRLATER